MENVQQIEEWVNAIIAENESLFIVSVKIKPTNNIKIFVDGDEGLAIDACVRINRKLYKLIEEAAIYPEGDFSLEVSSPGITEPLQLLRQYKKNIGREVEVVLKDSSEKVGTLLEVSEEEIKIEFTEGKGKKAVINQLVIPFSTINTTTVQIKF